MKPTSSRMRVRQNCLRLASACALTIPLLSSAASTQLNVLAAIEQVYVPVHEHFEAQSASLLVAVDTLCGTIDKAAGSSLDDTSSSSEATTRALEDTRAIFSQTVEAFSRIELLRVGPLLDENRLNRLFYWPDSRRVTERQLRQLLASSSNGSEKPEP